MPTEALKEAVRKLAYEASAVIGDPLKPIHHRVGALFIVVLCANPFAAACLIAIAILTFNVNRQHEMCMQADLIAREERREIAATAARERKDLEERITLREERNVTAILHGFSELKSAVERNTEAVTGKRFIQPPPKTEKK